MYLKNPYYLEALEEENKRYKARIKLNDITLENSNIKNIKYDLSINDSEKFTIGGVYGATTTLNLLNYNGEFDNIKFENKEFPIELCIAMDNLYTVGKFHKTLVSVINTLKIKHMTSLWIPQGKFYPTEITKNENKTITIKLIDKTKYLEDEYICNLTPPFTLKQLYDDVHNRVQIVSDTVSFYNQDEIINVVPEGYTYKQILGYIAECACGFYIINRLGNGEIKTYGLDEIKSIKKGKYKKFLPSENYITIQKIKYANSKLIGADKGYVLELDEKNPFINDLVAQNILLKMQGFTFIPYTYQSINADIAIDVGDKFDITNTNNIKYLTYVMNNSWEFTGTVTQNWQAKGENELNNTYSSKGPIAKQIENIINNQIPSAKEEAINRATELLTNFNGGYVVKKDGELFISDNEDIDNAQHIWRWNINGLGYSSTGINGPYGLAMTMDGKIVADFITTGTMSAERINGGVLKLGGNNNTNGRLEVIDANGNSLVTIGKDGLILSNGTKLIGNGGILSNFQYGGLGYQGGIAQHQGWNFCGFSISYGNESVRKDFIEIIADIPENFTVTEAYIILMHQPVYYSNISSYGYSRNVGLYKMETDGAVYAEMNSEYIEELSNMYEIANAFGSNGWTPTVPSSSNTKVETKKSINISSQLLSGNTNRLIIESKSNSPTYSVTDTSCAKMTGRLKAVLNVYGYMKT